MKEYTLLSLISVVVTMIADKKLGTNVLKNRLFYIFLIIIAGFKMFVNGYLTASQIVSYAPRFYLGIRLTTIPIEDFMFGFSMVTLSVIFWEYFKE